MKTALSMLACGAALLLMGCKHDAPDVLSLSEAYAYAPLTDNGPGVAYFALTNDGAYPLQVHSFASRCFAAAKLHRSVIEDNISRMDAVDDLVIEPGTSVRLSPNGLHLMLLQPDGSVAPGASCQVQISYGSNQELSFDVELLDRTQYRPAEPVK